MRDLLYIISCDDLQEALSLTKTFENNNLEWASREPNDLVVKRLSYPQFFFIYDSNTIYQGEYIPETCETNTVYSTPEFIRMMSGKDKLETTIRKELLIKI